jgi:hypothetical protein
MTEPSITMTEGLSLLREIRDEVKALRGDLASRRQEPEAMVADLLRAIAVASQGHGSSLTKADRAALSVLLPAIAESIGSEIVFTVADLVIRSENHPPLRAALTGAFGDINGSARRIGKMLARGVGVVEGGLHVERSGSVREGVLWRVIRV